MEKMKEKYDKEKAIKSKFFGIKDDMSIITSILHPGRIDNNGLPDVWCLDFKMKGKSKKITRDRRDLILDFCTEIEQHFPRANRNTILQELISLLTTYDLFAVKLGHKKKLKRCL